MIADRLPPEASVVCGNTVSGAQLVALLDAVHVRPHTCNHNLTQLSRFAAAGCRRKYGPAVATLRRTTSVGCVARLRVGAQRTAAMRCCSYHERARLARDQGACPCEQIRHAHNTQVRCELQLQAEVRNRSASTATCTEILTASPRFATWAADKARPHKRRNLAANHAPVLQALPAGRST